MTMHCKIALSAGFFLVLLPAAAMPIGTGRAVAAGSSHSDRLPEKLRSAFYEALATDAGAAYAIDRRACVSLPKPALKACFDRSGASFTGGGTPLALRLAAWGRGARLVAVAEVSPSVEGNRVSFVHGNLAEWWRVLPIGFEQGFTIAKRPPGGGELKLALATSREAGATAGQNTVAWGKLRYGQLVVTDARGHALPATLKTQGKRIVVAVNDLHAVYPLTVDPLVWLEQEVSANDGAAGDSFGWAVALSGRTALIGAPFATVDGNAYQGAAYVFTESNGRWAQTSKLVASDGESDDEFGIWVSLAGTTALVGAPFGDGAHGAAYVFHRSGGVWAQTGRLSANDGASGDHFGWSVATDGASALVGAPFATVANHGDQGAAYVFA
ncbi:MAG TPA: FG-GAP repeat protein, partial [Gammaproteobacteria bacterium]|nr:FG-GAP repeat protein [Gammaproteobacteria bacterium]